MPLLPRLVRTIVPAPHGRHPRVAIPRHSGDGATSRPGRPLSLSVLLASGKKRGPPPLPLGAGRMGMLQLLVRTAVLTGLPMPDLRGGALTSLAVVRHLAPLSVLSPTLAVRLYCVRVSSRTYCVNLHRQSTLQLPLEAPPAALPCMSRLTR